MIKLTIKGNEEQAREAAKRHGIELQNVSQLRMNGTLAHCHDRDRGKLIDWFCEHGQAELGKGFPIGTLLWHY